jgi:hypothetical protein
MEGIILSHNRSNQIKREGDERGGEGMESRKRSRGERVTERTVYSSQRTSKPCELRPKFMPPIFSNPNIMGAFCIACLTLKDKGAISHPSAPPPMIRQLKSKGLLALRGTTTPKRSLYQERTK